MALIKVNDKFGAESILNDLEQYLIRKGIRNLNESDVKARAGIIICRARIHHMEGKLREAERLFMEGILVQKEAYGDDSYVLSKTYSFLGTIQQILQKYNEAHVSYKKSLTIKKNYQDKNAVEITTVYHNWSSLLHKFNKHSEAERMSQESLILREKYLGHINIEVASSLAGLAAIKVIYITFKIIIIKLNKRCI